MTAISIQGLDKATVLAALYNASPPVGMGFLNPGARQQMTAEQAAQRIESAGSDLYFDYLQGRVMKIDLAGDAVDTRLYDRDNGQGSGARVIEALRDKKAVGGSPR